MAARQSCKIKKDLLGILRHKELRAGLPELRLESMEFEFLECVVEHSLGNDHTVSDLYASSGVLLKLTWVPVSVWDLTWQMEED